MTGEEFVYRATISITAPVHDTEVTDRVAGAIREIFPSADLEERHGELVGEAHSLDRFRELLAKQEILDTARSALFDGRRGDTISFALKKQAAFEGVVNFAVGEPDELGEIHVRIDVEDPDVETLIDHVAPATEDGRPVREI